MRKPFLLAALAASVTLIVLVGMYASAQGPGPLPARQPVRPAYSGSPIALVDVSYIFKEHLRFKTKMTEMKADVERAEADVKEIRTTIMRLAEQLQLLRIGSPDYKALDEEITKRQADLAVRVQMQKKEFLRREAKIYYQTYQEVLYTVDNYAKNNGISMVLRFNGDPVDMEVPQSVLQHINKPVVWYAQDRDITKVVLDQLNRTPVVDPNARMGVNPTRPGVYPPR
ncbi:MAG: OmpH family outer membrane protein [Thermoguttaceae bacterium]